MGCPIARTGWQKYAVKDLPKARADELGVDVSNPEVSIDLYRPAKEVFHPEFLASLNGVVITNGHPPSGEFVDPKNFNKYSQGHIQNVRKGPEKFTVSQLDTERGKCWISDKNGSGWFIYTDDLTKV